MLKEHKNINEILEDLEKKGQNPKKSLDKLRSLSEKHFFIEEKVIFKIYSLNKDNEDVIDLIKEHRDILWLISKLEENYKKELDLEWSDLKELLVSHIQFETEFFYPKLEQELDPKTKSLIIDQCREASCKELDKE
jgi:hypothetical protein